MIDSPAEIVRSYRMAADPKKQIKVLAELNACSVKEIETLTGFTFFRNLDPAVADEVKGNYNYSDWN